MSQPSRSSGLFPSLYAILDPDLSGVPLADLALQLAGAGVELMQLRSKSGAAAQVLSEARQLAEILIPLKVRFIVNDRPDIAALAGSDGVHVGQDDLPVEAARR